MRFVTYLVLGIVAIALVIVGFANRSVVTLTLLPADLVPFTKYNVSIDVPLYAVVFGGIAVGILLGFLWEWMREYKYRTEAAAQRRERAMLAKEIEKMKAERNEGKDDVLALLEDGRAT